ncbi:alpha carbonic anhydrase 7-like [Oryza brachyantha]|uniref:alpha carbonic anhydrase 7-like n=1 Tax=Oryza brachyantha TaxID=4533 RepID=UPI001ADD37C0|nr:alpha carbonic anhydrase 7-like [Oryza brachyantha]
MHIYIHTPITNMASTSIRAPAKLHRTHDLQTHDGKHSSVGNMHPMAHLLLAAAAALLLSAAPAARAQEADDQKKFSYVAGAKNGPENWSKLNASWAKCNTGDRQSPIDLATGRAKPMRSLGYLDYSYRPSPANVVNRGHDIEVKFTGNAGRLVIGGRAYQLQQLHWHTPSEHTADGRRYDMELHLVHDDGNDNIAVIGIFYVIGNADPLLRQLEPAIRKIADRKDQSEPVESVDPRLAKSQGAVYYRYMGSLTTPPCTEGVIWTVFQRPRTVAKYQLDLLREAVADGYENNARPIQKLNNREISIFIPEP